MLHLTAGLPTGISLFYHLLNFSLNSDILDNFRILRKLPVLSEVII